jgi:hypothetical protein
MLAESEWAPSLRKPWFCLSCSAPFKFGEAICADTMRCPTCRSADIVPRVNVVLRGEDIQTVN